MGKGQNWFLYNQIEDKRFDDLTFEAAIKVLNENVNYKAELENWLAWNENMEEWSAVNKVHLLFKSMGHKPEKKKIAPPPIPVITKKAVEPPPAPPAMTTIHVLSEPDPMPEPKKSTTTVAEQNPPDVFQSFQHVTRRKYHRYPVRLRVVLFLENHSFRTFTKDLSEGGMLLENRVPDSFLKGSCEIFIGSPDLKENVQFVGRVIGDPSNPLRFAFVEHGENAAKRMLQWLAVLSSANSRAVS